MAAAIAVNNFKTITHTLVSGDATTVYTAPTGYTAVFLLVQVTNTDASTRTLDFVHRRNGVDTEVVQNLPIVSGDTLNLLPGKLVLETGDSIAISGSTSGVMKLIASVLETSNF